MIYKDDKLTWMKRERKMAATLRLYIAFLRGRANEMQITICAAHTSFHVLVSALISIRL